MNKTKKRDDNVRRYSGRGLDMFKLSGLTSMNLPLPSQRTCIGRERGLFDIIICINGVKN